MFRLHENSIYGWSPKVSARAFMSILSNLTSLKIRATYGDKGVGFLDSVRLESAARGGSGKSAEWLEMCTCPMGYVGQFCESCAPGYRHSPSRGGPFKPCVPCDCNNHAKICDSETGRLLTISSIVFILLLWYSTYYLLYIYVHPYLQLWYYSLVFLIYSLLRTRHSCEVFICYLALQLLQTLCT